MGITNYVQKNERANLIQVEEPEAEEAHEAQGPQRYAWASLRITLGGVFLWAFLDKTFGLGYATKPASAWLAGGSPTFGFLKFGAQGPLAGIYHAMAGNVYVDWLFMMGLLLIGSALLLGIGVKVAGYSGALLMMLMYGALLPPENHPFIDEHIVYAIALVGLALAGAGKSLGFGHWWARQPLVRRYRILE